MATMRSLFMPRSLGRYRAERRGDRGPPRASCEREGTHDGDVVRQPAEDPVALAEAVRALEIQPAQAAPAEHVIEMHAEVHEACGGPRHQRLLVELVVVRERIREPVLAQRAV